jgi:hypothetical protein
MFIIKLFATQFKLFCRLLPRLIIGGALLVAVMLGFVFGAGKLLDNKRAVNKAEILIVMPQHDNYISIATQMLKNMKSTSTLCRFTETDNEEEALNKVANGEVYGAIIFPDNFVRGVVQGINPPAKIVIKENTNSDNALFKDLVNAGCGMLSAVQAGIYTIQQTYEEETGKKLDTNGLNSLNLSYVDFVMSREKYITDFSASATGNATVLQYYICMGLSVFVLLMGMSMGRFMTGNTAFCQKVSTRCANSLFVLDIVKQAVIFLFYWCIVILALVALKIFKIKFGVDIIGISMALWLASAITVLAYRLGGSVTGALIIFAVTVAFAFVGGAFLPTALLPDVISRFSPYSPVKAMGDCLLSVFTDKNYVTDMKMWLVMTVAIEIVIGIAGKFVTRKI